MAAGYAEALPSSATRENAPARQALAVGLNQRVQSCGKTWRNIAYEGAATAARCASSCTATWPLPPSALLDLYRKGFVHFIVRGTRADLGSRGTRDYQFGTRIAQHQLLQDLRRASFTFRAPIPIAST